LPPDFNPNAEEFAYLRYARELKPRPGLGATKRLFVERSVRLSAAAIDRSWISG
jgi:hypothetical protein